MLLGLASEREQAEAGHGEAFPKSWDGNVHLIWKELPVLWLWPRVRCLPSPLPAGRIVSFFDSVCNLYLEQLLPTPKVILSAAFSNSQVLAVATSPSATGPTVPRQEWDPMGGC